MKSYIEFTRVQQVKVPLTKEIDFQSFIDYMNGDSNMFDDDSFDFDNEEVVEEDYSFANHRCKYVYEDDVRVFYASPYVLGTLFKIDRFRLTKGDGCIKNQQMIP